MENCSNSRNIIAGLLGSDERVLQILPSIEEELKINQMLCKEEEVVRPQLESLTFDLILLQSATQTVLEERDKAELTAEAIKECYTQLLEVESLLAKIGLDEMLMHKMRSEEKQANKCVSAKEQSMQEDLETLSVLESRSIVKEFRQLQISIKESQDELPPESEINHMDRQLSSLLEKDTNCFNEKLVALLQKRQEIIERKKNLEMRNGEDNMTLTPLKSRSGNRAAPKSISSHNTPLKVNRPVKRLVKRPKQHLVERPQKRPTLKSTLNFIDSYIFNKSIGKPRKTSVVRHKRDAAKRPLRSILVRRHDRDASSYSTVPRKRVRFDLPHENENKTELDEGSSSEEDGNQEECVDEADEEESDEVVKEAESEEEEVGSDEKEAEEEYEYSEEEDDREEQESDGNNSFENAEEYKDNIEIMPEEIGYNMANPEEIKSNTEESEEEYSGEESEEKAEIVEGEENVYGYEDQVCGEEGDSGEDEAVFEKEEEMPSVKAESGEEEKVEVMEPEKIQSAEQNFAAPDHLKLQWEQCIKEQGGEEQSLIANDHDEEIISETEEQDEQQKMKDKKPIVTKVEIIRPAYSHPDDNNPSTSTSIGKSIASRNEGFYDAMMGGKGFEIPNGQPLPDEFQMEVPNSYTALHFSAASSYDTGEDFFLNFSDENGDTNDINYDL